MSLDQLRSSLASDAQRVPTVIQSTKDSARSLIDALNQSLDEALSTAALVSTRAQEISQVDTLPEEYTGFIHNYRFGMIGGKPMHRFDIEIKGTGLWLACTFTSTEFDSLLMTADPAIDLFEPEVIDGRVVTVKRAPSLGRLVPVTFGPNLTVTGPVLLQDLEGVDVRAGDAVSIKGDPSSFSRSIQAIVINYDAQSDVIVVQPKKQKAQKEFKVGTLARFAKIGGEVTSVGTVPLGQDMNGVDVFLDDIVRLYDETSDGRVAGRVTGSEEDVIFVLRGDGKVGSQKGWAATLKKTAKVARVPVGTDANGVLLNAGDRIQVTLETGGGYLIDAKPDNNDIARYVSDRGEVSDGENGLRLAYFNRITRVLG